MSEAYLGKRSMGENILVEGGPSLLIEMINENLIDNLKLTSLVSGKKTQSAVTTTEISFDIIEPYGFSFLSKLKRAYLSI